MNNKGKGSDFWSSPWSFWVVFSLLWIVVSFAPELKQAQATPQPPPINSGHAEIYIGEVQATVSEPIPELAFDHTTSITLPCVQDGTLAITAQGMEAEPDFNSSNSYTKISDETLTDGSLVTKYQVDCGLPSKDVVIIAFGMVPSSEEVP